jgi:hypothetical protein
MTNGLQIWEAIVEKLGCKIKTILFEMEREIKSDIFVTPFTEFIRIFKILFSKSIKIRTMVFEKINSFGNYFFEYFR